MVDIGSGGGQVSQDVTVPLDALAVPEPGLGAATIHVQYDPAVLDAIACDPDPNGVLAFALCNVNFDNDDIPPDAVGFTAIDAVGVPGDILLANLTFHCVGQGTSVLDVVVVQFADSTGADIPVMEQDGSITCTIPPPTPAFLAPAPAFLPTPPATPVTAGPGGGGLSFVTRRPMDLPDPRSIAPVSLLRATLLLGKLVTAPRRAPGDFTR